MEKLRQPSLKDLEVLLADVTRHWPMAKGSLAEVRKPCVRANCPACASGRRHRAFLFSLTEKGRRRCLYVPAALVPTLRQAIANGRWMEEQMRRTGVRLIEEHRRERRQRPSAHEGGAS
jgi:hypothetical protein